MENNGWFEWGIRESVDMATILAESMGIDLNGFCQSIFGETILGMTLKQVRSCYEILEYIKKKGVLT